MYIKDLTTGQVRKYGADRHDSLVISKDGKSLHYENLHNGDGSEIGNYRFCDENGNIPSEEETCILYGAPMHFNIGGFD